MLSRTDLAIPSGTTLVAGADTGSYLSGILVAMHHNTAFVLEEFPNYQYAGGEIELLDISLPEWARKFVATVGTYTKRDKVSAWADPNTQFRTELRRYKLNLLSNPHGLEVCVEVARSYFQADLVWLAPWLKILPYELEIARWPDDSTTAGKFERLKKNDHTLRCLEHVLSRHPRSVRQTAKREKRFVDKLREQYGNQRLPRPRDPHLGGV